MNKTMNKHLDQLHEVLSALNGADSALLFCHLSPDGDTLGSAMALKIRLERMGKRADILVDGAIPSSLSFLPCPVLQPQDEMPEADIAIAIDISSPDRMGRCEETFHRFARTLQIDHHGTNNGYAAINLVDGEAPATAVVLYRLLQQTGLPLTQEEAVCLYTALSTDTGNFIYESTSAESFRLMADLMEAGLPLARYSRLLFRQKEVPFVRLLGQALPGLRLSADGRIAGLTLTRAQMEAAGAGAGHTDGLIDNAIDLAGVSLAYSVREQEDGRVKASLRALEPFRVDGVAASLGGGGHKLAAGVTLSLSLNEAASLLESRLTDVLEGRA